MKNEPYEYNKKIIITSLEYLLAFSIVLDCNSVYANLVNSPFNLQKISLALSLILVGVIIWSYKTGWKEIVLISVYPAFFVFGGSLFISLFIKIPGEYIGTYIKCFLLFLPISIILFKLYRYYDKEYELFYRLSDIVLVLSIMSLVLWGAGSILGLIHPNKVIQSLWEPMTEINSYWGLQFVRPEQIEKIGILNVTLYRNIGLYPESPMFDIVLLIAFCTELFLKTQPAKGRLLVIFLTILSTFGTLAIIIAVISVFIKSYLNADNKKRLKYYIFLIVTGLIIIALLYYKKKYGSGSYNTHLDDLLACFKAWKTTPVFGNGFENNISIQMFMSDFRMGNRGYTTSAGAVIAHGGIVLMTIYAVPYIMIIKSINRKEFINEASFGIIFLIIFITFVFTYRFLMFWILAFGYSRFWWKMDRLQLTRQKF